VDRWINLFNVYALIRKGLKYSIYKFIAEGTSALTRSFAF